MHTYELVPSRATLRATGCWDRDISGEQPRWNVPSLAVHTVTLRWYLENEALYFFLFHHCLSYVREIRRPIFMAPVFTTWGCYVRRYTSCMCVGGELTTGILSSQSQCRVLVCCICVGDLKLGTFPVFFLCPHWQTWGYVRCFTY